MAKSNECATCAWERGSGVKVDTSRSKVAWAGVVGTSEASIRRHLKHAPQSEIHPTAPSGKDDTFLTDFDIPIEAVTSRGMSVRDPETGSWEKVTWHPNKKALIDSLKFDDLKEALDGWAPQLSFSAATSSGVAATLWPADLQIGKANQRGGGTPETLARVRQSFERFAEYVHDTNPESVVVFDAGDPIENIWNTPSQLVTNDLDVSAQIRVFRRLMLEGIKLIAPLSPEFYYGAVPSNHGAVRNGYKSQAGTTDADFGLEISYQIEDAIEGRAGLGHVQFIRPEPLDETAVFTVASTKVAVNHGHQSGGVFAHGKWWAGQDHGRRPGWDADIAVFGHYHTSACYQSGDGRWVIGCASSDVGSDWFTNRTGESALPGMTAFDVKDGQPLNMRLL